MASLDALEDFVSSKATVRPTSEQPLNVVVEIPGLAELIEKLNQMREAAHGYTPLAG